MGRGGGGDLAGQRRFGWYSQMRTNTSGEVKWTGGGRNGTLGGVRKRGLTSVPSRQQDQPVIIDDNCSEPKERSHDAYRKSLRNCAIFFVMDHTGCDKQQR